MNMKHCPLITEEKSAAETKHLVCFYQSGWVLWIPESHREMPGRESSDWHLHAVVGWDWDNSTPG